MSLLVVGSVALDTIETPQGRVEETLGGSAVYASLAASVFTRVRLVGVVGPDFPEAHRELLASRGIDLSDLSVSDKPTFRWTGRYEGPMAQATTVDCRLGALGEFAPDLSAAAREARFVLLANCHPATQARVLAQVARARLSAADTMNRWIETERERLRALLAEVDCLFLNDAEARALSGESTLPAAARILRAGGPDAVLVKRGEHGATLFSPAVGEPGLAAAVAYPLERVADPTGAGDSFAGAFLGSLASEPEAAELSPVAPPEGRGGSETRPYGVGSESGRRAAAGVGAFPASAWRRALVRASAAASFTVEEFGVEGLCAADRAGIERRAEAIAAIARL